MAVPLIVEVQLDDSALKSGVDKLQALGQVDAQSAVIFKQTNAALAERAETIKGLVTDTNKLTVSVTPQQAIYNKLVASVQNLSGASKDAVNQLLKLSANDVAQGFQDAAVSVDDYVKILENANTGQEDFNTKAVQTTTRLNQIKNELAALGPITEENAAQFRALSTEGGKLQEELNQSRAVIRNLGSESPVLTAVTNAARGLTGAFQAGAAAATLFGDKDKELEEVLVKIFQITSITQGIQEVLNTVNQKGTLTVLELAFANKVAAINQQLLTAAESENIIVSKSAAVAQTLLNAAIATGPWGILAVAIAGAVSALVIFAGRAKEAKQRADELAASLQATILLEEHLNNLKQNTEDFVAQLQARNAKESEITKAQGDAIRNAIAERNTKIAEDQAKADELEAKAAETNRTGRRKALLDDAEKLRADQKKLQDENQADEHALLQSDIQFDKQQSQEKLQIIKDEAAATLALTIQNSRASFAAQRLESNAQAALDIKAAGDNEGKIELARAQAAQRLRAIDAAEVAQQAQDRLASETTTLLKIQTESRRINSLIFADETAQQNKIIQENANARIAALQKQAQEDVTFRKEAQIQINQINAETQAQIEENNRQQHQRDITRTLNDAIAERDVILASVKTTNKERLDLSIQNEILERSVLLENAALTEKGKLDIVAQSEEKIRQLRLAAADKELNDNIELTKNIFAGENAEIQRQLDAQQEIRNAGTKGALVAQQLQVPILNVDQQIAKIQQLSNFSLTENQKRIDANNQEFLQGIKGAEDFTKDSAALSAERTKIQQEEAEKIRRTVKDTADFTKSTNVEIIQASFAAAQQVIGFVNSVFDAQDKRNQDRIDAQRKQVQDELAAGEITAKAAEVRNKQLDQQQKQLQRDQAKRQKEMALFNAIIQTASAVATALTAGPIAGVIAAAAAAAIGAAEIAVIASTPIPQFYTGKRNVKQLSQAQRDGYEGWAELGDRGPELWKSGSQTKLVDKSTVVWVKKNDIIYNAAQTASIMKGPELQRSSLMMSGRMPQVIINNQQVEFNYKKLADAVAKKSSVSLNIDGFKDFILEEKSFTTYLNKRRKWL